MDEEGRIIANSIIGETTIIKPFTYIKNSIIRNGCLIESFSYIHGAKIGEDVKILGHVFIPAGILIDHNSVIGPGVVFTNQKYPNKKCHGFAKKEVKYDYEWVTKVGRGVTIGAGAIIGSGIEIGEGAFIGMGSVVTKNVPPHSLVYGNPARIIKEREKEYWQSWENKDIITTLEKDWTEHMEQRRTLHKVLKELKEKHDLVSLLDSGCGLGTSFPFLRECGYQYEGHDVVPMMIERAKELHPDGHFRVQDILTLSDQIPYDVVLSADVLLHVPDPSKYLKALWKATGRVLILKLAYVWLKESRPDWDGKFYNWKFKYDEIFRMCANLNPKPKLIEPIAVKDDEKTSPDFISEQIWIVWKKEES